MIKDGREKYQVIFQISFDVFQLALPARVLSKRMPTFDIV
jgi:hypothetical protein